MQTKIPNQGAGEILSLKHRACNVLQGMCGPGLIRIFEECSVSKSVSSSCALQVMPKYADPTPKEGEGKFLIFDHLGKSFPTGQVWPKGCPADLGNGCFRMEFDDNNKHVRSDQTTSYIKSIHTGLIICWPPTNEPADTDILHKHASGEHHLYVLAGV